MTEAVAVAASTPTANGDQEVLGHGHSRARTNGPSPSIGFHLPSSSWKNGTANSSQVSLGPPVSGSLQANGNANGNANGGPATASSSTRRGNGVDGSFLTTSVSSQASTRQPNEEEDAFHVRNTYARLDALGVFGDGWDEGIERTRERAVAGKRPHSQLPLGRGADIDERERSVLARVDRWGISYGFFDQALKTRSESRLAKLPLSAFSKVPKMPKAAPKRKSVKPTPSSLAGPGQYGAAPDEPPPLPHAETQALGERAIRALQAKEYERVTKWEHMLSVGQRDEGGNIVRWQWDGEGRRTKKLIKRVYKGIPDRWRGAAWHTMVEERAQRNTARRKRLPFNTALNCASPSDVQIDLDVPRTISGHVLFHTRYGHGQRSLFHVLHAFSLVCPECGYCQGMGPIAATLLCYFDAERVYQMMLEIHDTYGMHSIFQPGFPGLLEGFYVQEKLIEYLMPDVYTSFQKNMISASSYATKWYITLFANTVPFQTQLRIWDAMFLDGRNVLVMSSVAIIWSFRALLAAPNANFESILNCLSSYYVPEDEDAFLRWIRKMLHQGDLLARMDRWRNEWLELVRQGKDRDVLL